MKIYIIVEDNEIELMDSRDSCIAELSSHTDDCAGVISAFCIDTEARTTKSIGYCVDGELQIL